MARFFVIADWHRVTTTALADHGWRTEVLWLNDAAVAARDGVQGELFKAEGRP